MTLLKYTMRFHMGFTGGCIVTSLQMGRYNFLFHTILYISIYCNSLRPGNDTLHHKVGKNDN